MALASTVVWEVRTTGNPANAGGFNSAAAGTDRSNQDAPHVIIDGVAITCVVQATTTDVAITGYTTVAADIGNTVRIAGGTMTAGTYEITAIPAAGQWRLDRSGGVAAQTGTGRMGGASSDPALIAAVMAGFNKTWVQSGTYDISSVTPNVLGGTVTPGQGGLLWQGYQTVRGDFGTAPVFRAIAPLTAVTVFTPGGNDSYAFNIEVDGGALVAIRGMTMGRGGFYRCRARQCTNSGIACGASSFTIECEALLCTTAGAGILDTSGGQGCVIQGCSSHNNTVMGFSIVGPTSAIACLSYANSGATSDGFQCGTATSFFNCVAYGNGRDGFRAAGIGNDVRFVNCLAEGNTGIGFNGSGVNFIHLYLCGGFNNTGGNFTLTAATQYVEDFVAATASFFTNAAGGNFALNALAGGGGLVRSNGLPGTFLDGTSTSYLDRGAVQTSGAPGTGGGGGASISLGQGTWVGR